MNFTAEDIEVLLDLTPGVTSQFFDFLSDSDSIYYNTYRECFGNITELFCNIIAPPCINAAQASAESFFTGTPIEAAAEKQSCQPLGDLCAEFLCKKVAEKL